MSETIQITVDGRTAEVKPGIMLLEALEGMGVQIPTLCHHPSLIPNGACRLCMVEITRADWNGWSKLVTSCLYPVEQGLQVFTTSDRVLRNRRTLLELYTARCPDSEELKTLARREGVDASPFPAREGGDNCILCGLCTRVCQDLGPAAIAPLNRGIEKEVGPRPDGVGEDCTGCRTCAHICPTGAIPVTHEDETISIWSRDFTVPVCTVKPEFCRACGLCEEVCPYSVPRVSLFKNGGAVSKISPTDCVGCGICAGVCPTGAISQQKLSIETGVGHTVRQGSLEGRTVIFACSRSPLPADLEDGVLVSCVGRVPVETILDCMVRGAKGVALICRDRESCPDCKGGELGEQRALAAGKLTASAGLGNGRVEYIHPEPGLEGPGLAAESFTNGLHSSPLEAIYQPFDGSQPSGARQPPDGPQTIEQHPADEPVMTGMDQALEIVRWLRERPELQPALPGDVAAIFAQSPDGDFSAGTTADHRPASSDDTLFYLGNLPDLDVLLSLTMGEWRLKSLVEEGARLLEEKGITARPVLTARQVEESSASRVVVFSSSGLPEFGRNVDIITLDELAGVARAGGTKSLEKKETTERLTSPASIDALEPSEFRFRITGKERRDLIERLRCAADSLICETPGEVAQLRLLLRQGSWQEAVSETPRMAFMSRDRAGIEEDAASPSAVSNEVVKTRRILQHPILPPLRPADTEFTFNGQPIKARKGEVISTALYAAGISVFGHHAKDKGPQGIFCVNGQCSQCTVVADGRPVKSCMTPVTEGMKVESCEGLPSLGDVQQSDGSPEVEDVSIQVLVVGGGPAGICAAIELGRLGVGVLIIDDKQELGGKLSLQTHNFFGSVADCYARVRGIDIGRLLADEVERLPSVKVWLNSTVVGVFDDGKFGVAGEGQYRLVTPETVLISAGAREKGLSFPGSDLPGVYGAGAFQTLVNRDLVRNSERLFIVGGGNVGLIGAYHALQAGIDVAGLVEALPKCGGYKVHEDKIKRLGVPVWTSHTVLRAEGDEKVERVVIAAIDENFQPTPGTERSFDVDTILIAVGLAPVDELLTKAREYGMKVHAAGDAEEIAEASAAIFSGKITGRRIARDLGIDVPIPSNWESFGDVLKHRPGAAAPFEPEELPDPVYPLIRCVQEIPCDPCIEACPKGLISMKGSILALPDYEGICMGCGECVLACPGLAIGLVINDYDPSGETALVALPFEFINSQIPLGDEVTTTDLEGNPVGTGRVIAFKEGPKQDRRKLLLLEVPDSDKLRVAGFHIREPLDGAAVDADAAIPDHAMVCRCERVSKEEIVTEIRAGVRDMNQLKAIVRSGMGGCGGKTCTELILRLFREEGVPLDEVTMPSIRPLVAEVHLGDFIKSDGE